MLDHVREFREERRVQVIKSIARDRKIDVLCHFTRLENLPGILQRGLLSRAALEERNLDFCATDSDRRDGCEDAICLSVSFPNYRMFYGKRKEFLSRHLIRDFQWVVLLLDARLLWELECIFCQQNASSDSERNLLRQEKRQPEALERMFYDFADIHRLDLNLPRNFPTNPQAEVLVFDPISATYIRQVHVWDPRTRDKLLNNIGSLTATDICFGGYYFGSRSDYEVWQSGSP